MVSAPCTLTYSGSTFATTGIRPPVNANHSRAYFACSLQQNGAIYFCYMSPVKREMKRQAEPARSSGYLGSLDPVKIPGKEGGQLAFVLAVLNGKERKFVRKYLMWQLEIQPGFTSEDCQTVAWIIEHPEFFENAVTGMVEAMRQVADMWIDSGKSAEHPDSDDPTTRTVDVILPRRDYSLYDRMRVGLFWNLPRYLDMNRDGTRRITGSVPRIDLSSNAGLSSQLEDFGERF